MRHSLKLGCWGYSKENFIFCHGTENIIFDLTKNIEKNLEITKFLDENYQLIRKPLLSNVHTVLYKIQDKFGAFEEKYFRTLEEFCILHKKCGLFLKIESKDKN